MKTLPRYAVYFVPASDSKLYRTGSALLGYDAYSGADLGAPQHVNVPKDWSRTTEAPRRYGFHATLCAPFYLSPGHDEESLRLALAVFGREPRVIPEITLTLHDLDQFIALVPREASVLLDRLAADCVRAFDTFRSPLSEEDRARRKPDRLSERQRKHLERWGYPYVFDDFRFHMTLTGSVVDQATRMRIFEWLTEALGRNIVSEPIKVDRITLLKQESEAARFRILSQAPLAPVVGPAAVAP